MKKKTIVALCLVLALLISLAACKTNEESYRMIQVLEVSGSVSLERESLGTMDVYAGMRLESGDKIRVGADSWLKIKMDEDKYALVEPDSVLTLEAAGSSTDSKTVLHLESGAISSRLEGKLGEDSSYEVHTPNSTMAVRGTVFRVEVRISGDGISVSDVSVFSGSVSTRLVHPDGTMDDEKSAVLILDGTSAQVWGDSSLSKYVTTDQGPKLDDLMLKTLEFLEEAIEADQNLSISQEELEELIEALEQSLADTEPTTTPTEETTEPTTAPTEETTEPTTAPTEETTEPTTAPTEEPTEPTTAPTEETTEPTTAPTEETTEPTTAPTEEPTEPTTAPTEESTEPTTAPTEKPTEPEVEVYTVTFLYNGTVFATQSVTAGDTAVKPILQPTASGSWDFDFTTPITQDTTITWIAS